MTRMIKRLTRGFEDHIVYGVAGEGLGHSMRAVAVAPKLLEMGYSITFLVGEKSSEFLRKEFEDHPSVDFIEIPLPTFVYDQKKNLNFFQTLKKFVFDWPKRRAAKKSVAKLLKGRELGLFITDYESITAWTAKYMRIPLVVLNSQDFYRYAHLHKIPLRFWPYFFAIKFSCWYFGMGRAETIVCHYDRDHIRPSHSVYLVDPMIRDSVKSMDREVRDYYIVAYLHPSVESFVLRDLLDSKYPVYIYGLGERKSMMNLHFCATDQEGFVKRLSGASKVVCCAGTTLPSECLYHKIPMLLIPIPGQKEQEFNAFLFSQFGVPIATRDDVSNIVPFINDHPRFWEPIVVDKYPEFDDGSGTAARIINSIIWKSHE